MASQLLTQFAKLTSSIVDVPSAVEHAPQVHSLVSALLASSGSLPLPRASNREQWAAALALNNAVVPLANTTRRAAEPAPSPPADALRAVASLRSSARCAAAPRTPFCQQSLAEEAGRSALLSVFPPFSRGSRLITPRSALLHAAAPAPPDAASASLCATLAFRCGEAHDAAGSPAQAEAALALACDDGAASEALPDGGGAEECDKAAARLCLRARVVAPPPFAQAALASALLRRAAAATKLAGNTPAQAARLVTAYTLAAKAAASPSPPASHAALSPAAALPLPSTGGDPSAAVPLLLAAIEAAASCESQHSLSAPEPHAPGRAALLKARLRAVQALACAQYAAGDAGGALTAARGLREQAESAAAAAAAAGAKPPAAVAACARTGAFLVVMCLLAGGRGDEAAAALDEFATLASLASSMAAPDAHAAANNAAPLAGSVACGPWCGAAGNKGAAACADLVVSASLGAAEAGRARAAAAAVQRLVSASPARADVAIRFAEALLQPGGGGGGAGGGGGGGGGTLSSASHAKPPPPAASVSAPDDAAVSAALEVLVHPRVSSALSSAASAEPLGASSASPSSARAQLAHLVCVVWNAGVALLGDKRHEGARALFAASLSLMPPSDACRPKAARAAGLCALALRRPAEALLHIAQAEELEASEGCTSSVATSFLRFKALLDTAGDSAAAVDALRAFATKPDFDPGAWRRPTPQPSLDRSLCLSPLSDATRASAPPVQTTSFWPAWCVRTQRRRIFGCATN